MALVAVAVVAVSAWWLTSASARLYSLDNDREPIRNDDSDFLL